MHVYVPVPVCIYLSLDQRLIPRLLDFPSPWMNPQIVLGKVADQASVLEEVTLHRGRSACQESYCYHHVHGLGLSCFSVTSVFF